MNATYVLIPRISLGLFRAEFYKAAAASAGLEKILLHFRKAKSFFDIILPSITHEFERKHQQHVIYAVVYTLGYPRTKTSKERFAILLKKICPLISKAVATVKSVPYCLEQRCLQKFESHLQITEIPHNSQG